MALKEYLDSNGVLFLWTKLKALLSYKVDKVDGKQLSTEDYTTEEKQKLSTMTSVVVDDEKPTDSSVGFWVDTSSEDDIAIIPEVKDDEVSSGDTWSSQKISSEIGKVSSSVEDVASSVEDVASSVEDVITSIEDDHTYTVTGNPVQFDRVAPLPINVSTEFRPKQDKTYGDPYPEGAGKNKACADADKVTNLNGLTVTSTKGTAEFTFDGMVSGSNAGLTIATLAEIPAGTYIVSVHGLKNGDYFNGRDIKSATYLFLNLSDNTPKTFTVDAATVVSISCVGIADKGAYNGETVKIQIEPGTEATEYAPYSNIRPLAGWDALNLNHSGKNLFLMPEEKTLNGVTLSKQGDAWVLNGTATSSANFASAPITLAGGEYTLCANNPVHLGIGYALVQIYSATTGDSPYAAGNKVNSSITATITGASNYVCRIRIQSGVTYDNFVIQPQLELGSVATAYDAYQHDFYIAQLGQTVYGGSYDWNTGNLLSEWAIYTVTGNESWQWGTSMQRWETGSITVGNTCTGDDATGCLDVVCSHSKTSEAANKPGVWLLRRASDKIGLRWKMENNPFADADELKAWLAAQYTAGTPVQFAYKLAEPYTIQLTPHELESLKGINTIYGDGEITVSGKNSVLAKIDSVRGNLENAIEKIGNTSAGRTYTLGEIKTNDIWVDGSPIYHNILEITGTNTAGESLSIPLGDFKFGHLILLDGGFSSGEDYCHLATTHNSSTTANVYTRIRYATTAPELRIVCGSGRSIGSGYAILEYTKTVD